MRRSRWLILVSIALAASVVSSGSAQTGPVGVPSALPAGEPAPVASLDPEATERLWRRLVATRSQRARVTADCRPLRAVFYAATDYLRLATKLAASASPCAQYYVSIPPLVADKTQMRPNAAWRVRALGSNFHALAEVHFTTWNRWVANTGSSWYTAGVTARERMAAAGFDMTQGDAWALNEASTAVRRGTGSARANLREFLRGLYEGDGSHPIRGALFIVGVGQQAPDVSLYQTNLQNWFTDSTFWEDMARYVSDWSQEVYGDVRNWAVPGVPESARRDYLADYLEHQIVLAAAGPPTIDTARAFLQTAYSPLANAAWERESGYGWTLVPPEQMAAYVSAQIHALRFFSAMTGQAQDHWGFAWSPRNATGASPADFAARTDLILDRLGAAVRDSAESADPADPGGGACGPPGQNVSCVGDLPGARLTEAWKSFRSWTQSVLAFATPQQTIPAGTPSAPISLVLETASGLSVTTPTALTITLSSSSPRGEFASSSAGPWSATLTVAMAAGTGTTAPFYYRDTRAGEAALTASAPGATSGTQTETIAPGPVTALTIRPASATVPARASQRFTARARDAYANPVQAAATWSIAPRSLGVVTSENGGSAAVLAAARTLGSGTVTVTASTPAGAISATAGFRVTAGRLKIGSIVFQRRKRVVYATVRTVDVDGAPISRAAVRVLVSRNGRRLLTGRALTGPAGKTSYRVRAPHGGCFVVRVRSVVASGFAWDGRTPRNRFCMPR